MIQQVDHLATWKLSAILGQRVRVYPGVARQEGEMSRRFQPKWNGLICCRHGEFFLGFFRRGSYGSTYNETTISGSQV